MPKPHEVHCEALLALNKQEASLNSAIYLARFTIKCYTPCVDNKNDGL